MNSPSLIGPRVLREIEISDFRGIERLHLSFIGPDNKPVPLVVIGGPNGSGKTAVLEACLLATGNSDLIRGSYGPNAIRRGAEDYTVRAVFQVGEGTHEVVYRSTTAAKPPKVNCDYFSSWRAPKLVGAIPITARKKGKRPAANEENRLWVIKQFLVNAKAYSSMATAMPMIVSEYEEVIQQVNEVWRLFYPSSSLTFSVEPAGTDPDAGFDVFLKQGGTLVPLDALSSGQLEIFLLAGSSLPRREKESILFIDEPELHLDPQWHRIILRAITRLRKGAQIIVGTHSPEIYESVMSYQRHFLVSSDDPRATEWSKESGEKK